jgi:cysteine desulfurase
MGVPESRARASLRFGLGRFTTIAEIDFAIEYVAETVNRLRSSAPSLPRGVSS